MKVRTKRHNNPDVLCGSNPFFRLTWEQHWNSFITKGFESCLQTPTYNGSVFVYVLTASKMSIMEKNLCFLLLIFLWIHFQSKLLPLLSRVTRIVMLEGDSSITKYSMSFLNCWESQTKSNSSQLYLCKHIQALNCRASNSKQAE